MLRSVVGLQIRARQAAAVQVRGGWKGASVEAVRRIDLPPPDSPDLAGVLAREIPATDTLITGLAADRVFTRLVVLPFRDRSKVLQAAPLEAEESLPLPLEDLVWDVHLVERSSRRSRALLAAAPERYLDALLAPLAEAGRPPAAVDVEPLALWTVARAALPAGGAYVLCDLSEELAQALWAGPHGPLRVHALAVPGSDPSVGAELARFVAALPEGDPAPQAVYLSGPACPGVDREAWSRELGIPVEPLPFPGSLVSLRSRPEIDWPGWAVPLGLALKEVVRKDRSQVNLLRGRLAAEGRGAPWKGVAIQAAVYAGICLALWGALVGAEMAHRRAQYAELRTAVRNVFHEVLPDVRNVVSELDQMKARVEALEARAQSLGSLVDREVSPLRILREISVRIPRELEVEFRDFVVEEGRVRIEGVTTSFDAIDRIKADLAAYPRFAQVAVSDAKTMAGKDKVLFKLTITLGREG